MFYKLTIGVGNFLKRRGDCRQSAASCNARPTVTVLECAFSGQCVLESSGRKRQRHRTAMQGPNKSICSKLNSGFLRKWWIVVIISIGLIVFGGIVALFFRSWMNLILDSEIVLKEGSKTYDWWRKPPVHPIISVYVYNVTNADEFLNNGEKPKIVELGPYVYRETWEKVNLEFHDNGTVSFQQKKIYHFVKEMSFGLDEDLVVVPNIPMLSATSQSKHAARFLRLAMASIMEILKVRPFVEVSVKQLLWGYEDPLLKLAKDVVPKEQKLPYLQFGLMYGKNDTSQDRLSVFTGADHVRHYGLIDRFNGMGKLPHWKTDECNRINGSDGSIFPPHMSKETVLSVFDKDICRTLPLVFQKEVISKGDVKAYRFSPPEDVFADIERNPDNECFCPSGPPCAPHGFFNVSVCQFDSPILLSFPHFYLADQKYREEVEGISPPDPEKHKFYIDVQPEMGTALAARARVQINLAVSQVVDIKQVASFPDIIFPIMWFEEGMDGLPPEVTDLLRLATEVPPVVHAVLMYGLFGLGVLLLILAVSCLVRSVSRQETLTLAASNHFVKPEKPQPQNGKQKTMETLNPAFENPQH